MTVPTFAEGLQIARTILGSAFAVATVWVATLPALRRIARLVRRPPSTATTPTTVVQPDELPSATRAA